MVKDNFFIISSISTILTFWHTKCHGHIRTDVLLLEFWLRRKLLKKLPRVKLLEKEVKGSRNAWIKAL